MIRLILGLAVITHVVLAAPTNQENAIDTISYKVDEALKNITEIYYIDTDALNEVKSYFDEIFNSIKQNGHVTAESLTRLKDKILKAGENLKDVAADKIRNAYEVFIDKAATYFEIIDAELKQFLNDVKPNVDSIGDSVRSAADTISVHVGVILDNIIQRVGNIFNEKKKEG